VSISRELAAKYGLTTADQAPLPPPRPKPPEDHAAVRVRWSPRKTDAFNLLGPKAVVLVATDGPVSVTVTGADGSVKRFGHNRGVWPAKVAKTGAWRDTVSSNNDKFPLVFFGTQARFWCLTEHDRDKLAESVVDLIAERAKRDGGLETLRLQCHDLGPDLDMALFEMEIAGIAQRLNVTAFDDHGLSSFLDRTLAAVDRLCAEGRAGHDPAKTIERVALALLGR